MRNEGGGFAAFIPHSTFPSFLWKEVPRRGGGWLSMRYFHMRGCQPRLASLVPLPEEGARMILDRASLFIKIDASAVDRVLS